MASEFDTEYLRFGDPIQWPGKKTYVWQIYSKHSGDFLGRIKWFGRWRQYTFFPEPRTVWNIGCLEAVNRFIKAQMDARKT